MAKTEKFSPVETVIKGTLINVRKGTSKYDDKIKTRFSVVLDDSDYTEFYETCENAYADSGSRMTPKWLKERNGYVNLTSNYDVPTKDANNRVTTLEELIQARADLNGSLAQVCVRIKEGSVYPISIKISAYGEERDLFSCFD